VASEKTQRWQVVYYQDRRGRRPVREFLDSLGATDLAAVMRGFALLEEFGLAVGAPHVRSMGGYKKLWELRVRAQRGAIRLFYFAHTGRRFVILHGFVKKSGKTPRREIETAVRRMQDLLEWGE
jgi:phage-related protein